MKQTVREVDACRTILHAIKPVVCFPAGCTHSMSTATRICLCSSYCMVRHHSLVASISDHLVCGLSKYVPTHQHATTRYSAQKLLKRFGCQRYEGVRVCSGAISTVAAFAVAGLCPDALVHLPVYSGSLLLPLPQVRHLLKRCSRLV